MQKRRQDKSQMGYQVPGRVTWREGGGLSDHFMIISTTFFDFGKKCPDCGNLLVKFLI